jgi:hypothetical protein
MKQGQYQWQYYHTENAWPVVNAFNINSTNLNDHPVLKQKLLEISGVEHNNHLRGGIVNIKNSSDPSWIVAMKKLGYRYAVIWLDGCWPSDDEFNYSVLDEVDRINAEFTDWVVAGDLRILDNRFAYFNNNVMIINLENFRGLVRLNDENNQHRDQQIWGRYSREPIGKFDPVEGLWERYESKIVDWDDESVYGIQRFGRVMGMLKDEHVKFEMDEPEFERKMGMYYNSQVTAALFNESDVPGLSDKFMSHVSQTKPHINSVELEKAIQGDKHDSEKISYQANRFIGKMFNPSSPIYFVNTEPSQPMTAQQIEGTGFDQYVGASAGFKLFYYAQKYGFNSDTKFLLYDFDPASCKFKQDTLAGWDGKNYPAWVGDWLSQNPGVDDGLYDLTKERWPRVVDQFGGESEWLNTWHSIQTARWEVINCDLIYGHDILFERLEQRRTFLWTSNIYSYIIPKVLSKPFALEESFIGLIKKLKALDADSWFSGTDINDNDLMCPVTAIISTTNNESIGFEQ